MIVPRSASGAVQLVARELSRDASGNLLVALPPEPGLPAYLGDESPHARFHHLNYAVYRKDLEGVVSAERSEAIRFGEEFEDAGPVDRAVLFLPKEKELAEHVFARLARRIAPGTPVLVAGENRGGIRSVAPLLEATLGPVVGRQAGRHAVVWTVRRMPDPPAPRDLSRRYSVTAGGEHLTVVSHPGVFSHGELDPGTRLLLEALGRPVFQRALDWGCGSGILGAYLRKLAPEAWVDLVDVHALALRAARETLAANGFETDRVYPSDGFSDVRGTFDLIVTNPPFHAGIRTEFSTTERMIRECGRHLLPGGRLVLVANRFLRHLALLQAQFGEVRVLAETPAYRVYEASNG